jgi:hypothetical protein
MDEEITQATQPEATPQTYWQAHLDNGTTISEPDMSWDALKAGGKNEHITSMDLCTPAGDATLTAGLPGILFPFSIAQGTGIARIENSAGQCVCVLWDETEQRLVPEAYFNSSELSS